MTNDKLSTFIEGLNELNKQNSIKIMVPSAGKEMEFNLFNVSQHKELVRTAFEGYEGVIKANSIYDDIIKQNSLDDDCEFSLADRAHIIVQLRKESLSETYNTRNKNYNLNDLPEPNFNFDYSGNVEHSGIKVSLAIPSLVRDSQVSNKLISDLARLTGKSKDTESVNVALAYEIVKFIKSIEIGEDVFEFTNINIYDCAKLVDSLPLKLNNQIVKWISKFRTQEESNITFEDGVLVEIDASFLAGD